MCCVFDSIVWSVLCAVCLIPLHGVCCAFSLHVCYHEYKQGLLGGNFLFLFFLQQRIEKLNDLISSVSCMFVVTIIRVWSK